MHGSSRLLSALARSFMEPLEGRVFLSASGVTHYLLTSPSPQTPLLFDLSKSTNRSRGAATSNATPAGYSPSQIATAYHFSGTSFGGITGDGSGQTIAIVDAFNDVGMVDSNSAGFLSSDLHVFDQQYGLPDPVFIKMSQTGSLTNLPAADPSGDWELEESLDVEWAHAMAPKATILLVEANSQNQNSNSDPTDLLAAVDEARNYPGVVAVSMSWGYPEFSDEVNQDYHFTTPAGHTPVTFVASAGDNGTPGVWPAYSPNVVAVGGTTLTLNSNNTIASETAWSYNNSTGDGGGGGISAYEPLPSYQVGAGRSISGSTNRNIPDVAYDGDPSTGFPVYDSTKYYPYYPQRGYKYIYYQGWIELGGTSAGSPQVAAIIAIADQGRQLNGSTSLDGPSQTLPEIYTLGSAGSSDFRDIISGQTNVYAATYGYDCATGYGTIVVNSFVSDLLQI